jgi:hypothetical protein
MSEANRQKIKDEVAAGEARHRGREDSTLFDRAGEAAIEAKDRFSAFAREHPLTTVAGGLALGILISGLFPRSPTRRLGRKTVGLAAVGAEAAMAYMHKALDAAGEASRSGAHRLDDWSEVIGDAARRVTREAAHLAENAGQSAGAAARETGERVSRHLPRRR